MPQLVQIDPRKLVVVTEEHGGYCGASCVACDASGWLDGYGYPHTSTHPKAAANKLRHTKKCVMNTVLNNDGTLKRAAKKQPA